MEGNNSNNNNKKNYYKFYHNHNNGNKFYYKKKNNNNKHGNFYYYKKKRHNNQNQVLNENNEINNSNNNQDIKQEQNIDNKDNILLFDNIDASDFIDNENIVEENNSIQKDINIDDNQVINNVNNEVFLVKKNSEQQKENNYQQNQIEINQDTNEEKPSFFQKTGKLKYVVGVLIVIALLFGVSYSFFTYYKEDTRQADISSGEVYVRINEQSVNLTLSKMYPRTNEEARSRNDNYIDFTVLAKNTSETKEIVYTLNITNGENVQGKTRIDPQYLVVDLQEKVGNNYNYIKEAVPLSTFSFEGIVPVNTGSEITKEYRLRIWVSDAIIISDTESNASYTQSEFANLYANVHVEVNTTDRTYVPLAADIIGAIQTLETTPYGKVYTGANPDNYVWFNNEQWRIIGVYTDTTNGDMLKIIKATPYATSQKYNSSTSSNAWSGSSMQTYLYDNYDSIISDTTSRGMIYESGKWNVGDAAYNANASTAYNSATGTPWTGKIGLIASYEYQFGATSDCWSTSGYDYSKGCSAKDWLYTTITNNKSSNAWTLSPYLGYSGRALYVLDYSGCVYGYHVTYSYAASPVVYLKPTIKITGGNGGSGETNSYKLG